MVGAGRLPPRTAPVVIHLDDELPDAGAAPAVPEPLPEGRAMQAAAHLATARRPASVRFALWAFGALFSFVLSVAAWNFVTGLFAPTKAIWSVDNRTAGFRLCGEDSKGVRVECRIGGSDLNPYLALAVQIAAGLRGIEEKLDLAVALEAGLRRARQAAF